jgi:hypothetical protein
MNIMNGTWDDLGSTGGSQRTLHTESSLVLVHPPTASSGFSHKRYHLILRFSLPIDARICVVSFTCRVRRAHLRVPKEHTAPTQPSNNNATAAVTTDPEYWRATDSTSKTRFELETHTRPFNAFLCRRKKDVGKTDAVLRVQHCVRSQGVLEPHVSALLYPLCHILLPGRLAVKTKHQLLHSRIWREHSVLTWFLRTLLPLVFLQLFRHIATLAASGHKL